MRRVGRLVHADPVGTFVVTGPREFADLRARTWYEYPAVRPVATDQSPVKKMSRTVMSCARTADGRNCEHWRTDPDHSPCPNI